MMQQRALSNEQNRALLFQAVKEIIKSLAEYQFKRKISDWTSEK